MLIQEPDDAFADEITQRMRAIIQSSDDAILAKDLNGIITGIAAQNSCLVIRQKKPWAVRSRCLSPGSSR